MAVDKNDKIKRIKTNEVKSHTKNLEKILFLNIRS